MKHEEVDNCVPRARRMLLMEPNCFLWVVQRPLPPPVMATTMCVLLLADWESRFARQEGDWWQLTESFSLVSRRLLGGMRGAPVSETVGKLGLLTWRRDRQGLVMREYIVPTKRVSNLAWAMRGMPTPAMEAAYTLLEVDL